MRPDFYKQLFLSLALTVFTVSASAAQPVCPLDSLKPNKVASLEAFRKVPLLNEGRIKPAESYAKNFLLRLSGRGYYGKESAIEWFARFLFAPRTTFDDKVFMINNPEILEAINAGPEKKRRYSYRQLEGGYDKIKELAMVVDRIEDRDRSAVEREILRLYGNLSLYIRLSGAFAYAFPHPDFTIEDKEVIQKLHLDKDRNQFSFYDIFVNSEHLNTAAMALGQKDSGQWSDSDKEIARIINAMFFWTDHYANCPLGIIPTSSHEDEQWLSPMDVIRLNLPDPVYMNELKFIREMMIHYWNNSQLEFDLNTRSLINSIEKRLSVKEQKAVSKIPLELLYNRFNFLTWAKLFYGLAVFLVLFSFLWEHKLFYVFTAALTGAAFVAHLTALVLRILIMSRPPVSNLYETFIFVGLISVILGFIVEKFSRNWLGLVIASTSGFVFLLISGKFSADGDTMQMLVAVLNSNFWLSTHVLSITTGYAGCCVAGIIGHFYILHALFRPNQSGQLKTVYQNLTIVLGFGLTMTVLGTALGGIWADQSWGRFWGWDPKENGALLTVLWCAILFHARLAGLIHPLGMAVGGVVGLIVVMWAWFGVNLLSVGLHSYGFTSGVANTLGAYVIAELLFVGITAILLGKKGVKI